jgi:hypothetical protein
MQKYSNNYHHNIKSHLALCGLLGTLVLPATGTAGPLDAVALEPAPIAAADDPPCEKSTVQLEVDVATGLVYLVNHDTGAMTLTDNDINVYFGSLGDVIVMIHYNTGNWAVTVTPDQDPPVTYRTTNGWVRYSIAPEFDQYVFSSTDLSTMSAMSAMTPVVPDIVIRPKKDCPPSP